MPTAIETDPEAFALAMVQQYLKEHGYHDGVSMMTNQPVSSCHHTYRSDLMLINKSLCTIHRQHMKQLDHAEQPSERITESVVHNRSELLLTNSCDVTWLPTRLCRSEGRAIVRNLSFLAQSALDSVL
jgi:hypothetical protein